MAADLHRVPEITASLAGDEQSVQPPETDAQLQGHKPTAAKTPLHSVSSDSSLQYGRF